LDLAGQAFFKRAGLDRDDDFSDIKEYINNADLPF
jgi:hypothetical protein